MYKESIPSAASSHIYETACIVFNKDIPKANEVAEINHHILSNLGIDVEMINSLRNTSDYQSKSFQSRFKEFDNLKSHLWVVEGGDGSHSNFSYTIPKSPIIFHPTGHINDISSMLYSRSTIDDIERIVIEGKVKPLNTLEIRSKHEHSDVERTERALGYYGIGMSGYASNIHNHEGYRRFRDLKSHLSAVIEDRKPILTSLKESPYLRAMTTDDDNESFAQFIEVLYTNGSRMAKVFKFRGVDLLEPGARVTRIRSRKMLGLSATILRSTFKDADADSLLMNDSTHEFTVYSGKDEYYSQRDGEVTEHKRGNTQFIFSVSENPLKVISTR